ncbi:MAG TPA: hypothetical protein VLF67_00975 [Candidatus Saccharimonas sp.]|nr:hypothetical protein [Candidatus Saccharimonas sp.]
MTDVLPQPLRGELYFTIPRSQRDAFIADIEQTVRGHGGEIAFWHWPPSPGSVPSGLESRRGQPR